MKLLSVLIPAKNETDTIVDTVRSLVEEFDNKIEYEVFIINDHSDDTTEKKLIDLTSFYPLVNYGNSNDKGGVGNAIKYGINNCKGDVIAICMADGSDAPSDILESYRLIREENFDCVFGSRFITGSSVKNYPVAKKILNRLFNHIVRVLSQNKYDDFTNIFKVYRREVIQSISPINSEGFSIGLEMSLKAFKTDYNIKIIPISWRQRTAGSSKLKLYNNLRTYSEVLIQSIKWKI